MRIEEIFRWVEGSDLAMRLSFAGNLGTLVNLLERDGELEKALQADDKKELAKDIFRRLQDVSAFGFDPRYQFPWDVALTVYLWILVKLNFEYSKPASKFVLKVKNTWWAEKLAKLLISDDENTEAVRWERLEDEGLKVGEYSLDYVAEIDFPGAVGWDLMSPDIVVLDNGDIKPEVRILIDEGFPYSLKNNDAEKSVHD